MKDRFARIEVRVGSAATAERVAAEAYAAGALGLEEREDEGGVGILLLLYAPMAAAQAVADAARIAGDGCSVSDPVPVPEDEADASEVWKRGLGATVVSPRLRIRPSFVVEPILPGQSELVIDPGQAFGIGGHLSTRLALEWVDILAPALGSEARVLDVGTGTGVLALAALRRSEPGVIAVALDLDPLATAAAAVHAEINGLKTRLRVFTGPLEALREALDFDLVVANLSGAELLPALPGLAARVRPGGQAVLSGLLAEERGAIETEAERVGLVATDSRHGRDASDADWISLICSRQ
ncbi:MAG: 50S ribosomal protein L11 methyltransferase [Myxococcota bacterium]